MTLKEIRCEIVSLNMQVKKIGRAGPDCLNLQILLGHLCDIVEKLVVSIEDGAYK